MSSPECPGWYPHHPVGWLTPSNRKGLLPWPTMLTQKAEEEPWLSYIISCSPGTWWLYESWNPQEKGFQSVATMNRTFTRCNDRPEESCEFCYSWEHSWNEIKLKTTPSPFQRVWTAACHYLNWERGTFWKRRLIGCSRSFCQSEQSLTLFPSLTGVVPPLPTISWQRTGTRFPQSAVSSRCASHLFSFIHISNTPAPGRFHLSTFNSI